MSYFKTIFGNIKVEGARFSIQLPTPTPTPTLTPSPTLTPTPSPTLTPTLTLTPSPTLTPTPSPTLTPTESLTPAAPPEILPSDPQPFPDTQTYINTAYPPLTAFSQGFTLANGGQTRVLSDMYGYIKISTNNGTTWTEVTNAPIGTASVQWATVAASENGQRILVCRDNGVAYSSNDGGITWTASPRPGFTCAMSYGGRVQLIGGSTNPNTLYVSTDYGNTWTNTTYLVAANSRGGVSVSKDGNTCLACLSVGGVVGLYVSRDSGATWSLTTAPAGGYRAVTCSSKDGAIMYGFKYFGDLRAIKSTDYGQTWADASTTQIVGAFGAFTSYDGKYVLTTCRNGRGVFISKDSGATWTQYNNGTDMSGGGMTYSGQYFGFVTYGTNNVRIGNFGA